jgi:hypothetical protein
MRALILNPVVVAVSAGIGLILCALLGWNPHERELIWAAGICLAAGEVAMLPLLLYRGAVPMHPAQAGLLATVLHLMVAMFIGGGIILLLQPVIAFAVWLMVFYGLTLAVVFTAALRAIRASDLPNGCAPK